MSASRAALLLAALAAAGAVTSGEVAPGAAAGDVALGRTLFNQHWVSAAIGGNARGLGPLFNAASCDACHNGGAGGLGPAAEGVLPQAVVVQLEQPARAGEAEPPGDPIYGHVLNTQATAGVEPEGVVSVTYSEIYGYYYPEGTRWQMRAPHYRIAELTRGALATDTIVKPRLAPPLYGVGLLEAVPGARFGWQGAAGSLRDQTTRALARDMGLTSSERPRDDCTAVEADCEREALGYATEVSREHVDALVAYLRSIEVPPSAARTARQAPGARLFASTGCANCHLPQLPAAAAGAPLAAYTDLRLHDLGRDMEDENVAGARVPSRWRTAPLWGLAARLHSGGALFLHDGRARSVEEAVLWHAGEAEAARRNFVNLLGRSREQLLRWLESL